MELRGVSDALRRQLAENDEKKESGVLRLRAVEQRYGNRPVLGGVDLDVAPGRCVALLGENGSGKSTLLRIAAGREQPTAGTAQFKGEPVSEDAPAHRAQVATVVDQAAHYPDLTVHEHLMLVALAHGLGDDARPTVDEALAEHRLAGHADAFPDELSSGQRQLMALATVRVRPYELLILDEPEQRLDTHAREELAQRLLAAKARSRAVLLATHDHTLAAKTADEQRTLHDGEFLPARGEDGDVR